MARLNITPCKNVLETGSQRAQIAGQVRYSDAINVSSDDTATALPLNDWADYYRVVASASMNINVGGSGVTTATTHMEITAGIPEYLPNSGTHIVKNDI